MTLLIAWLYHKNILSSNFISGIYHLSNFSEPLFFSVKWEKFYLSPGCLQKVNATI